jgi:hypothetical protein
MDREAALRQRAWSGHPRACELQTLAALEGAVNDILHELGPTFVDLHVGPRLMPMAGSYPPEPIRALHDQYIKVLNGTSTARP